MFHLRSSAGHIAAACALGVALGVASATAGTLEPRVMVLPSEGEAPGGLTGLSDQLAQALTRGARRTTPTVERAATSLADTAVVVGCDPADRACLDAVAAALNVDQLLLVRITTTPDGAEVEVTAVTREAPPVKQTFRVRPATRAADVAAIEAEVPALLEAGEAQVRPPGDGTPTEGVAGGATPERIAAAGRGATIGAPDGPRDAPVGQPRRARGPYVVLAAGGASLLTGAVFWGLADGTQGDIDAAPTETAADLDRLAELESKARTQALTGNVLVIGGGLVLAAGAVWWMTSRSPGGVTVTAGATPTGAGLVVGGRW